MKSVTALLSDLMLVNNDDFTSELRGLKSCTIATLQSNLIRLHNCIDSYLNNIKKHNIEITEVKNLIDKYGITIQELHLIESEMLNITKENKQQNNISSEIILNKLNAVSSFR